GSFSGHVKIAASTDMPTKTRQNVYMTFYARGDFSLRPGVSSTRRGSLVCDKDSQLACEGCSDIWRLTDNSGAFHARSGSEGALNCGLHQTREDSCWLKEGLPTAMDFNPLDLLASTALRDNRATQPADTTSADLKLLQPEDADAEEEDDDETDGDGDDNAGSRSAATNGDVMPCLGCEVEDDTVMGSVKTGKDKRTFGKSVVLAAEDSVLAEKKILSAEETNLSSKIAITEPLGTVRTEDTETGRSEDALLENGTGRMCNGEEEQSTVNESDSECNGKVPPDPNAAVGFPTPHGDTGCEESAEKKAADTETENASTQAEDTQEEHAVDTDTHSCQADGPSSTGKPCVSDLAAQDQNLVPDCISPEAQTLEGRLQESDTCLQTQESSSVDDTDIKIDQDLQMAVGLCNNCDDEGASSVTPLPLVAADADACPGKPVHRPSADTAEDSGDAFESADENASAGDIEHRPRSLSVDSEYLQYGVSGMPHELDGIPQADKNSLMSPTPSVDSVSNDSSVSENSNALGPYYSILLPGYQNQTLCSQNPAQKLAVGDGVGTVLDNVSSESAKFYNPGPLDGSACPGPAPKCGKFRIGTFASFSSSNLELDRDMSAAAELKERRLKIGIPSEPGMKSSLSSPALISPGSPFPLLQSPGIEWDRSDAGSEIQDDLDSSTTDDKYLSSSHGSDMSGITSVIWNHPVFHDHDYCCKETSERVFGKPVAEVHPMKVGKRNFDKPQHLRTSGQPDPPGTRPVGRPRKRLDRQIESDIDPETGAKMKITGKFQDQYVYYLSKTSRNRRRKLPEGPGGPSGDKIILPAPKPGDIVVPHLSDADIEAIKHGGRAALKRSTSSSFPPSQLPLQQQDHVDMDSSIVNTILSMESDNLGSPMPAEHTDISDPISLYEEQPVADGIGFMGENMNLTPDQVDLLLSVVKDVEVPSYNPLDHGDTKLATSQALDFLTSGDTVHMGSPALDSVAATTVDKDILGSPLPSSNGPGSSDVLNSGVSPQVEQVGGETVKAEISPVIKQEAKMLPDTQRTVFNGDMPPAGMSVPSLDKTLEFLKGDFKPDFFPESSVPQAVENAAVSTSENDTPWIVTVTIYWNDIPAIIINNQPYVRLVDIHKQILPAKDTGILKKRCQLMNIPVLNCSDMQRYFLVQYGRAYNSKSTLVINKDQARELIGYYVDPQPRGLRADDGSSGASLKRSSSCVELGSYSDSSVQLHPPPFASPRRRGGFRRKVTPNQSQAPSPDPASPIPAVAAEPPPSTVPTTVFDSPSKRLRHKKINFLEMLKGEDSASSSPATPSADSSRSEESLGESYSLDQGLSRVSPKATNGHKRRHNKEVSPETLTGRRNSKSGGSRERKKSTEGKTSPSKSADCKKPSPVTGSDLKKEADITVVVDTDADSVKIKKRSPGLSSAVSTSSPNRAKAAKFGPLKVKLKGLLNFGKSKTKQPRKMNLFGRKAAGKVTVQTSAGRTLRVLKVAHQDAGSDALGEEAMSQIAEVHLDLYKRRMSPCIKCWTCEKFLSVPSFLQHQHSDASSQDLVSVKQLQVLVPMNKENISLEEKRLWNEFVGLQKRLDRSPLTACSMTPRQPLQHTSLTAADWTDPAGSDVTTVMAASTHGNSLQGTVEPAALCEADTGCAESQTTDANCINVTSPAGSTLTGAEFAVDDMHGEPTDSGELAVGSMQQQALHPPTHTQNEEKSVDIVKAEREIPKPGPQRHHQQRHKASPPMNVRTSSRKRKEKQFFSIENYSFSRKSAKLDADHREAEGDVTAEHGENGTHVVTLSNGPEFVSFTSMQDSA
ncbi:hypothetical protein BaRGS_00031266, partial [Batillaria attramentaria]